MTDTYLLIILGILLASGVGVNVFLFRQEQQSKKDFAQLSELLAQVIIKIDAATSQNKTLQDLTNQKLIQLTQAVSKELLDETVNTRKVIEALKTSLEESIKF